MLTTDSYVRTRDLPNAGPSFEAMGEARLGDGPGAAAIGSRLVELTDRIAAERCEAIAHRVGPLMAGYIAGPDV